MSCGYDLRHLMHRRAHIDAIGFRCEPVRQHRIHRRIEEDSQGTENDYRSHRDGHFTGFRLDDRLGSQNCGGAADAATGANQPAGMFVEAEDLLPEVTGDKKGAGQRQYVDSDTADADIGDLGERQAKTV